MHLNRLSSGSVRDPHRFSTPLVGNSSPVGRTLVNPAPVAGETTGQFVTIGQSNGPGANYVNVGYSPVESRNHTLSIFDGGMYATQDPMLGSNGSDGSWGARLADKLIDAGIFDRVIMVPTEVGSTTIAQWAPGGTAYSGTTLFERIIAATYRAIATGNPVSGYLFAQGESDNLAGTSQATYEAALNGIIAAVRAYGADFEAPWFVGKCTYHNGTTSSAVRAAQAAVVNGTYVFAGGDTDTLTGATNRETVNNVHFNATGANAAADLWKTAIDAVY